MHNKSTNIFDLSFYFIDIFGDSFISIDLWQHFVDIIVVYLINM